MFTIDAESKRMRSWDIFCTVVDNYGDVGVSWRLARQLAAEHGARVRLWLDDLAPLARLCPGVAPRLDAQRHLGVEIRWWREPFAPVEPADIVVEAFACNPPAAYVAAMAARQPKPAWINLEYLSAENWVLGCHGLPSPHPSLPLVKHFFFPGFVAGTGGLLGERELAQARTRFQGSADEQAQFWREIGVAAPAPGEFQVSLFCYPHEGIVGLLRAWAAAPAPLRCLVPEGTASQALQGFFGSASLAAGTVLRSGNLNVCVFPFLDQDRYDRLLWACDFNLVRGEDSFVRAQWAARPMLWQIYPQQEDAHWPKLQAFLDLYCRGMHAPAAASLRGMWEAWNRADAAGAESAWTDWSSHLPELQRHARRWAEQLTGIGSLANNLALFCENLLK